MRIPVFLLINLAASVSFSPLYASANNAEEQDPIAQPRAHNASPIDVLHAIILRERAREENPRPHGIVQLEDSFEEYNSVERSYGHDEVDDNDGDLEQRAIERAIKQSLADLKGEPEVGPSLPATDVSVDHDLEEAIQLSIKLNAGAEKSVTDVSKLHFQLDADSFPMEATVLQKANWKTQEGKTLEAIANQLREKGVMTTKTFLAQAGDDTVEVFPILGGGDCGFFAYGKGTNRYDFVRNAIDVVLTGSRLQEETRQASVDTIRKIFTHDLIQVANLHVANDYLKKLGSKQGFEDLFGKSTSAEPHVLANFIYECYGKTLECLSIHALKALALMNNHTLFIWQTSPEEFDTPENELSLMEKNISTSDTTIHIYYDGRGHFQPAVPEKDRKMKKVANDKSFISEHLQYALEEKGIGAQEYEEYTQEMKDLYIALCS
ncbi:MAG: hypothetical protein ACTHJ4_05430 [Candidatus Nucleicultricaceae bacterium]